MPDGAPDTHLDRGRGQRDRIGASRTGHQHRNVKRKAGVNGGFDAVRVRYEHAGVDYEDVLPWGLTVEPKQ